MPLSMVHIRVWWQGARAGTAPCTANAAWRSVRSCACLQRGCQTRVPRPAAEGPLGKATACLTQQCLCSDASAGAHQGARRRQPAAPAPPRRPAGLRRERASSAGAATCDRCNPGPRENGRPTGARRTRSLAVRAAEDDVVDALTRRPLLKGIAVFCKVQVKLGVPAQRTLVVSVWCAVRLSACCAASVRTGHATQARPGRAPWPRLPRRHKTRYGAHAAGGSGWSWPRC